MDRRYVLDSTADIKIGRGLGCQVAISDPLSSRIHASINFVQGQWILTDAGSRNGTLVNGSKVDKATLYDGCKIRIGNTELQFNEQETRQSEELTIETINLAHSMIDEEASLKTGRSAFAALRDRKRFDELYELYQLAFMCINNDDLESTIEQGLSILRSFTKATIVGFLSTDDLGDLKPFYIDPSDGAQRLKLSQRLTDLVVKQATAIWTKHELRKSNEDGALRRFSDAICIPLVEDKQAFGAIHLYRETEQFQTPHFDFRDLGGQHFGSSDTPQPTHSSSPRNQQPTKAKVC